VALQEVAKQIKMDGFSISVSFPVPSVEVGLSWKVEKEQDHRGFR
jgi:hypothetical protein